MFTQVTRQASFLHEYIYLRAVQCFSRSCHTVCGCKQGLLTSASLNPYQEVKAEIQGTNEVSLQPCVSLCARLLHASEVTGAGGNKQQLLAIFHIHLHSFLDFNISSWGSKEYLMRSPPSLSNVWMFAEHNKDVSTLSKHGPSPRVPQSHSLTWATAREGCVKR